jgi:hypothetical protein
VAGWQAFRANRAAMYTIGAFLGEETLRERGEIAAYVAPVLPASLPVEKSTWWAGAEEDAFEVEMDEWNVFNPEMQKTCQAYIIQDLLGAEMPVVSLGVV